MSQQTATLHLLSEEILPSERLNQLLIIAHNNHPILAEVIAFDASLGGPSLATIDDGMQGRYEFDDREVFRPLQYCKAYFGRMLNDEVGNWFTREIVQMSSLHIEALVKRIGCVGHLPLGQALRLALARRRIEPTLWRQIDAYTHIYNDAKHYFRHNKDTHLFSIKDALLAYFICRALGAKLYHQADLATDLRVFD